MKICKVEICERRADGGYGLCSMHYKRYKKHGDPEYVRHLVKNDICSVDGCNLIVGEHGAHGMCHRHARKEWGKRTGYSEKMSRLAAEKRKATKYGMAIKHPLYRTWSAMKDRCVNKNNKAYGNYGGRGIYVDERWLGRSGFWNFVDDMGPRPDGYSIDRVDVNGPYSPDNCRWTNRHIQNINRRQNREHYCITIKGGTYTVRLKKDYKLYKSNFKNIEEAIEWRESKLKELWG